MSRHPQGLNNNNTKTPYKTHPPVRSPKQVCSSQGCRWTADGPSLSVHREDKRMTCDHLRRLFALSLMLMFCATGTTSLLQGSRNFEKKGTFFILILEQKFYINSKAITHSQPLIRNQTGFLSLFQP